MAGHFARRASALGVTVAVAIGTGAAMAAEGGGLKGSPAAVRVAGQVLAHARHVTALRWRQSGDEWECPSSDGPIVGPARKRPARNCRRATVTFDENLRDGQIVRSESTTVADGLSTQTELVTRAGDWTHSSHERCWDAQGTGLVNIPAFSYTGEKLSIAGRPPGVITLHGVGVGFQETDTIDARTFAVLGVDERVPGFGGTAQLVASFAEMTRPFVLPMKPRRVCPEIVRFPPQHRS